MIARNRIALITGSATFSGSIERVKALGDPTVTSSLSRIEFSNMNGAQTNFTASSILNGNPIDVEVPGGFEILGPIGRIQSTGSDSKWLIYYK